MSDAAAIFNRMRNGVETTPLPDVETRLDWLRSLRRLFIESRSLIQEAVWNDFEKSNVEADLTELMPVLLEFRTSLRHLKAWAAPRRVHTSLPLFGISAKAEYRPKGVVLIVSPWNYPFSLSLGPLISALAAGNRVILKPSERVPNSSSLIARIVHSALPDDVAAVIEGGPETGDRLLKLPFDHFFFTGGEQVGKVVARAAANHLSTCTLELGGKSPAVVDGTLDLEQCAEKIVRGKYLNRGQTCVAPDYAMVRESHFDRFVDAALSQVRRFESDAEMSSPVDDRHASYLIALEEDAVQQGATIHRTGAQHSNLGVATGVPLTCRLMQEEIFGPILPVLRYRTEEELFGVLARNPTPLTTYLFSRDDGFIERISQRLQTGSICINETLLQFVHSRLPFGGVGRSGSGHSHGQAGFETFSNLLPVMKQNLRRGILPWIYPPAGPRQERARRLLFRFLGGKSSR